MLNNIFEKMVKPETSMKTFLHVGCGPQRKNQTTPSFAGEDWKELRFDIDRSNTKGQALSYCLSVLFLSSRDSIINLQRSFSAVSVLKDTHFVDPAAV